MILSATPAPFRDHAPGSDSGDIAMRHPRLALTSFVAAALAITAVLAPVSLSAQGQPQGQPPAPVIGPYKPVPIKLPAAMNEQYFDAFRKKLADGDAHDTNA